MNYSVCYSDPRTPSLSNSFSPPFDFVHFIMLVLIVTAWRWSFLSVAHWRIYCCSIHCTLGFAFIFHYVVCPVCQLWLSCSFGFWFCYHGCSILSNISSSRSILLKNPRFSISIAWWSNFGFCSFVSSARFATNLWRYSRAGQQDRCSLISKCRHLWLSFYYRFIFCHYTFILCSISIFYWKSYWIVNSSFLANWWLILVHLK